MTAHDDPITYVVDEASELTPLLRVLHAPDRGRVHCYASSKRVVSRVLDAMGNAASNPLNMDFAIAWLVGRGVHDIFIDHADRMDTQRRRQAIELAYRSGVRVWLVDPEPGGRRALAGHLRKWAIPQVTAADFRGRWQEEMAAESVDIAATGPASADESAPALPEHLPDSDFFFFADDCRRLIDERQRDVVLDAYWSAFDSAANWIDVTPAADRDAVLRLAWDIVCTSPTVQEAVIRLKATQAALFTRGKGLWMQVEHIRHEHAMVSITSLDEAITRLHRLASPHEAALALIVLAFRPQLDDIAAMRVDDISAEGSTVTIGSEALTCPPCGRSILRAHRLVRQLLPHTGDHLFGESPYDSPLGRSGAASAHLLGTQLFRIANRTDLPVTRGGFATAPSLKWQRTRRIRFIDFGDRA